MNQKCAQLYANVIHCLHIDDLYSNLGLLCAQNLAAYNYTIPDIEHYAQSLNLDGNKKGGMMTSQLIESFWSAILLQRNYGVCRFYVEMLNLMDIWVAKWFSSYFFTFLFMIFLN